jgi:hypothetical protein
MTAGNLRDIAVLTDRRPAHAPGISADAVSSASRHTANRTAESAHKAAWNLGEESGNAEVMARAQEMRAWFALMRGDYRGVLDAAGTGHPLAPHSPAAVQPHAQKAKARARTGDRRQAEVAPDQERALLERLPYPENLDNHFAVDPAKWDFYSMDCYRILGGHDTASTENKLAGNYAQEILRTGIDGTGFERTPMRNAEARITLGVISAREGELEQALDYGRRAIAAERLSVPSLLMVSTELATIVGDRFPTSPDATDYLDQLKQLRSPAA